jgi:hypothetical protein
MDNNNIMIYDMMAHDSFRRPRELLKMSRESKEEKTIKQI